MKTPQANSPGKRRDRFIQESVHDPYKLKSKPSAPTVCPVCRAVFLDGRWQWLPSWPENAREEECQACLRTKEDYPAGLVVLHGSFVREHKEEILQLLRHQEEAEKSAHPMHRIMSIQEEGPSVILKTTDIHLPRRMGDALQKAYKGTLDTHYKQDDWFVRVHWTREA